MQWAVPQFNWRQMRAASAHYLAQATVPTRDIGLCQGGIADSVDFGFDRCSGGRVCGFGNTEAHPAAGEPP